MTPTPAGSALLGVSLALYVVALFGLALWARGRIHDAGDYVVAGRRLSLPLATATLFGTWFGAGTLLAASDEVRTEGVRAAALDPLGAGLCLILAGLWLAAPLWRMRLLTIADFFRGRFGERAELVSGIVMVPGYFGWIAAQFVALASVLELFFGLDPGIGIALVAVVGTGYTLLGGMWSVVVTDLFQVGLLLVGLVVLGGAALDRLGAGDPVAGLARIWHETPETLLAPIPLTRADDLTALLGWVGLLCAGALGNLPGQDLMQRVFAARSAATARAACLTAGVLYLGFGAVPVLLGLAAHHLAPDGERALLPFLAGLLLSPALVVVFVLALFSAVLSTIDSAILAPATVLAQNVLGRVRSLGRRPLALNQASVLLVAASSLAVAYLGENAYALLEGAYELGLVSLLVPLALGLYSARGGEAAALAAMGVGTLPWLAHLALGWEWLGGPAVAVRVPVPMGIGCAGLSLLAYLGVRAVSRRGRTDPPGAAPPPAPASGAR